MSDDERAFLRAVIASPDDDVPRLAFADWLAGRAGADRTRGGVPMTDAAGASVIGTA